MQFQNSCDGFYANSLDVRFTKVCDNNCKFCIEKNGISGKETDVNAMIESTIKSGKTIILILGGEPLLKIEQVLEYINGIKDHVNEIYITTSLPKTIESHKNTFNKIMNLITGLNVSLQHYDPIMNNKILHASSNHNRINILQQICQNETFANKTRVSINLVKDAIDSKLAIDIFLNIMQELNVKHVKINELQNEPDLYVSFEDTYGIKLPSPYSHGCQTEIKLPNYKLKITLKRACFCVNDNLTATLPDLCKVLIKKYTHKQPTSQFMVLYEDGTLRNKWEQKQ